MSEQTSVCYVFQYIYAVIITHAVMHWWKGMVSFIHGLKNGRAIYSKSLAETHTHMYVCTLFYVIVTRHTYICRSA